MATVRVCDDASTFEILSAISTQAPDIQIEFSIDMFADNYRLRLLVQGYTKNFDRTEIFSEQRKYAIPFEDSSREFLVNRLSCESQLVKIQLGDYFACPNN
jgi:hypothetical protein